MPPEELPEPSRAELSREERLKARPGSDWEETLRTVEATPSDYREDKNPYRIPVLAEEAMSVAQPIKDDDFDKAIGEG